MIRSSVTLGVLALVTSGALHFGGLSFMPRAKVLVEGGAQLQEVRLGNSFQDVASGVQSALTPQDTAEESPPSEATETPPPEELTRPPAPEPLQSQEPETTEPRAPTEAAQDTPSETAEAPAPPEPLKPLQEPAKAPAPQTLAALLPTEALPAPAPEQESEAPQVSRRPALRPKTVEDAAAKAKPKPKKTAKAQKPKPQKKTKPKKARKKTKPKKGTNAPSQRAGKATGTSKGKAKQKSAGKARSKKAGNAKASNYAGLVMRKISRMRRPRVDSRGTARVAFRVSSSGSITSIRIAKSSGSAALDKAALQLVRRAAPFPRPPQGAQRSFTVSIKSK